MPGMQHATVAALWYGACMPGMQHATVAALWQSERAGELSVHRHQSMTAPWEAQFQPRSGFPPTHDRPNDRPSTHVRPICMERQPHYPWKKLSKYIFV
jgi:hypothetical protein